MVAMCDTYYGHPRDIGAAGPADLRSLIVGRCGTPRDNGAPGRAAPRSLIVGRFDAMCSFI